MVMIRDEINVKLDTKTAINTRDLPSTVGTPGNITGSERHMTTSRFERLTTSKFFSCRHSGCLQSIT